MSLIDDALTCLTSELPAGSRLIVFGSQARGDARAEFVWLRRMRHGHNDLSEGNMVTVEKFDLNDIEHEPTDEQLASLMAAVAEEAQRKAALARAELMVRLRAEIAAVDARQSMS